MGDHYAYLKTKLSSQSKISAGRYFSFLISLNFGIKMHILRISYYLILILSFCLWVGVFCFLVQSILCRKDRRRQRYVQMSQNSSEVAGIFNSWKQASTRGLRNTSLLSRDKKNYIKEASCSHTNEQNDYLCFEVCYEQKILVGIERTGFSK